MNQKLIVVAVLASLMVGCGRPVQKEPGQWFATASGLDLPAGSRELDAEAIVVLAVGDTYYLRLSADDALRTLADAEFETCAWSDARDYLVPPDSWMDQLPFWDKARIKESIHYRRRHKDESGTDWLCRLAIDAENHVAYFVGVQTRE
jgi:hypothetical protein